MFSGIVALGLASISGQVFHADKNHRPEKMGYAIAGVVREGGGEAAAVPIEALLAKADPAKGEAVFKKCASCHTAGQGGANGIGPNLYGIIGAGKAAHAGFAYSDDLKKLGGTWDFKALNEWLLNPKGMAAGTKMTFAGLDSGEDRANLMVWLNTQGSNVPLPAAPAADAAAAPAADGAGPAAKAEAAPAPKP